tara:strand:+ start:6711 stop:7391 length:681 start_codon:yes stop_codon:yes gene_type:complete
MKKELFYILALLLISVLAIFWSKERDKRKDLNKSIEAIQKGFQFKVNEKDSLIAYQDQIIIDRKSDLAKAADTIQGLKNQKQRIRIKYLTKIERDTIYIDSTKTITIDSINYLKLPFVFEQESKWYGYKFRIGVSKVIQEELEFRSELEVIWGEEDHGFVKNIFKKNDPIVTIIQKNPQVRNQEIENYVFKNYNKGKIKFGAQVGYGITNNGLSPYAGVGLTFNIL